DITRRLVAVSAPRNGYGAGAGRPESGRRRAASAGLPRKPASEPIAKGEAVPPPQALRGTRPVYFAEAGRHVDTPSYDRVQLVAGNRIDGPALIEEYASTTVVHPGDAVTVDAFGDLVIDILRS